MIKELFDKIKHSIFHIRVRITLGLLAVGASLLVSCIISVFEFVSMRSYVSELIAKNIANINAAQTLASLSNEYNLDLLAVIGEEGSNVRIPSFNQNEFLDKCDSLKLKLVDSRMMPLADSVVYSYSAYMLTSLELQDILLDDFTDTRDWYFGRLQPKYNRLRNDIDVLTRGIYSNLQKNSKTFERGFYKSIIPGMISSGVSLLLLLLLLFFLISNYAIPICKMNKALAQINSGEKKTYNYKIEDGDDEINDLNNEISTISERVIRLNKKENAHKRMGYDDEIEQLKNDVGNFAEKVVRMKNKRSSRTEIEQLSSEINTISKRYAELMGKEDSHKRVRYEEEMSSSYEDL